MLREFVKEFMIRFWWLPVLLVVIIGADVVYYHTYPLITVHCGDQVFEDVRTYSSESGTINLILDDGKTYILSNVNCHANEGVYRRFIGPLLFILFVAAYFVWAVVTSLAFGYMYDEYVF